ncbi:hypothetical protein [Streptomyces caniscabiei]|uniref:hypothetical protein n=1 Tax=Streptomyces caniscabiei TaxID=2746961 RepID=UPI000A81FDA4|nr:hypothetical protein [Streptomyces caniscabiei]
MSDDQQANIVETLYLEAEHFALIAESRPPLEPRERVVPIGEPRRPFPKLAPGEDPSES